MLIARTKARGPTAVNGLRLEMKDIDCRMALIKKTTLDNLKN